MMISFAAVLMQSEGNHLNYDESEEEYEEENEEKSEFNASAIVIVVILGLVCVAISVHVINWCCCRWGWEPEREFEEWNEPDEQWIERGECLHGESVFIDGKYSGYFVQHGSESHFHDIPLHFNEATGTISLFGVEYPSDDVGSYSVTGRWNKQKNSVALQKHYIQGTGDDSQNLGHVVRTRLQYDHQTKEFVGKWMVISDTWENGAVEKFCIWLTETGPVADDIEMADDAGNEYAHDEDAGNEYAHDEDWYDSVPGGLRCRKCSHVFKWNIKDIKGKCERHETIWCPKLKESWEGI